jgi:uncharacterized protein (TIGR03067 family)
MEAARRFRAPAAAKVVKLPACRRPLNGPPIKETAMRILAILACGFMLTAAFAQDNGPKKDPDKKEDKKDDKKDPDKKDDKKDDKDKKPPPKTEPTILEGVWTVVSMEYDGKKTADDKLKGMQVTFQGDQLTVKQGKKILGKGSFTLDAKKEPAAIDYREGKDVFSAYDTGIFALDGDDLKWCHTADRKNRPKEFDSKQGMVVVLKKDKESKKEKEKEKK